MKKKQAVRKQTRRRERNNGREQSAQSVPYSPEESGTRVKRLSIACLLLLAVGSGCLLAFRWYVHTNQVRLANACRQAKIDRDWPQMELFARQWAVWQPGEVEPWLEAANAATQMGNPQRAAVYLSSLPDDAPVEAFHELGRLQLEVLNKPLSAVETCKRTLRIYPADSESHQRLLSFYAMTCQRDEMANEARRAIRVGSESLATYAYLVATKWLTLTNGFAVNNQWLEADPNNELFSVASRIHLIANPELIQPSQQTSAVGVQVPMERYEQMVAELLLQFPKNVELIACRGNLLCQFGQVEELARVLSEAPAATESDSRFWRFKGWYHTAREEWSEAKIAYERALQLWPYDWVSQHELAIVLRRSDTLENASKMQQQATLGKEVMRAILLAPRFDVSSRETFEKISAYMQLCGDRETAQSLKHRLEHASK